MIYQAYPMKQERIAIAKKILFLVNEAKVFVCEIAQEKPKTEERTSKKNDK